MRPRAARRVHVRRAGPELRYLCGMKLSWAALLLAASLFASANAHAAEVPAPTLTDAKGGFHMDLSAVVPRACLMEPEALGGIPPCPGRAAPVAAKDSNGPSRLAMIQLSNGDGARPSMLLVGRGDLPGGHALNANQSLKTREGIVAGMAASLHATVSPGLRSDELALEGLQVLRMIGDLKVQADSPPAHFAIYAFVTAGGLYMLSTTGRAADADTLDALASTLAAGVRATPAAPDARVAYWAGYVVGVACAFGSMALAVVFLLRRGRRAAKAGTADSGSSFTA